MRMLRLALVFGLLTALGCTGGEPGSGETAEESMGLVNGAFTEQIDGRTIHYQVHGNGPVVMAVTNSWGLSLEGVRGLFAPLEERLTMVYFDPRGMGESGPAEERSDMGLAAVREDFDRLRRHLGLDQVHAIGWSNGAMNLIHLAAEYPEIIRSAIFVHGVAHHGQEDNARWADEHPELAASLGKMAAGLADPEVDEATRSERIKQFWMTTFFPKMVADPEDSMGEIVHAFKDAEFSWAHFQYTNQQTPTFDARSELPKIQARCLVIAGAHDMMTPEDVRELHEGLANSRFEVFEDSGHFAPLEQPERFERLVFEFLGV